MTDKPLILVPNDSTDEANEVRRQTIRKLSQQTSLLARRLQELREKTDEVMTRYMATLSALSSVEHRAETYQNALRELNRITTMSEEDVLLDAVLSYYYENPNTTQQQAADAMGFSVTKLRSLLGELENRGLVSHENRNWIALEEELPVSTQILDK